MTDLQRAKADRETALKGLRDAQATIARLEAQLARSLWQTEQAVMLALQVMTVQGMLPFFVRTIEQHRIGKVEHP